jgi:hypothetical protein
MPASIHASQSSMRNATFRCPSWTGRGVLPFATIRSKCRTDTPIIDAPMTAQNWPVATILSDLGEHRLRLNNYCSPAV